MLRRTISQPLLATVLAAIHIVAFATVSVAGSAEWDASPLTGDWDEAANWTPDNVPNDPADVATFDVSDITALFLSENTRVNAVVFNPGASSYAIRVNPQIKLTFTGTGIANESGATHNFITVATTDSHPSGKISFINSASAGDDCLFENEGNFYQATGITEFRDTSSAGSSRFINYGSTADGGDGGFTIFYNQSSAGVATFTNKSSTARFGFGGGTLFHDTSSAADATFLNNASTGTFFYDTSTAGAAMIVNDPGGFTGFGGHTSGGTATFILEGDSISGRNGGRVTFGAFASAGSTTLIAKNGIGPGQFVGQAGGRIEFQGISDGGTSRIELLGNGTLDIGPHATPGVAVGSIEGNGIVLLGANSLTVGSNNLDTEFSGVIRDGGIGTASGGGLTKINTGRLILSGIGTYTGPTTVDGGALIVNGSIVSSTTVQAGTLGGSGIVKAVTVENGATLSPGDGTDTGVLNVTGKLTLRSGSNYVVYLKGATEGVGYSQTNVTGSVTLNNAMLAVSLNFTPKKGTKFTIIKNDGKDAVNGTFLGLPEGAKFTIAGVRLKISYKGGRRNDVVVMVTG